MNKTENRLLRFPSDRGLVIRLGFTAIVVVIVSFVLYLYSSYEQQIENTRELVSRLAVSLDSHLTDKIESIEAQLGAAAQDIQKSGPSKDDGGRRVGDILKRYVAVSSNIRNMIWIDADGHFKSGGLSRFVNPVSYAGSDCFVALSRHPELRYFIGMPVGNPLLGQETISVCLAMADAREKFSGILEAIISLDSFTHNLMAYSFGPNSGARIVRLSDGVIIGATVTNPNRKWDGDVLDNWTVNQVGRDIRRSPVFRAAQSAPSGLIDGGSTGNFKRIASFRTTPTAPKLLVIVSYARSDFLADWANDSIKVALLLLPLVLLMAWVTRQLIRQTQRREVADAEIERLNWTLSAIGRANTVLLRATSETQIFREACEAITFEDEFAAAWIGVPLEDDKKTVQVVAFCGKAAEYVDGIEVSWGNDAFGNGPSGLAIRTGLPRFNNNMLSSAEFQPWRERARQWNLQSSFSTPVKLLNGQVIAVLVIYSERPDAFGEEELGLFSQLGNDIGFGVDMLRTKAAYTQALALNEDQGKEIELISNVLERSAEGVIITDVANRIVFVNTALSMLTGYPAEECIGKDPSFLSSGSHDRSFFDAIWRSIEGDGNWQGEILNRRANGEVFPGWLNIYIVRDQQGSPTHYVASLIDITERKKEEQDRHELQLKLQESEKKRLIGNLASGIAHDFNNMIGAIMGFANFLVEDLANDTAQHKFAIRILGICERSQALVKQILIFARAQSFEMETIDLRQTLLEACDTAKGNFPRSTDLKMDLCPSPLFITGNAVQVAQISFNLCLNASEAFEGRAGHVTLTLAPFDPASGDAVSSGENVVFKGDLDPARSYALLRVRDNGPGVPPDVLKQIFDPFFSTKKKTNGTGLGLAVVDGLVTAHGGAYSVRNFPGQGAEFSVWLPCVSQQTYRAAISPRKKDRPVGRERVLVVDDETEVCDAMTIGLERLGYHVLGLDNPLLALAAVTRDPEAFDVLVSDMTMPGLSGMDLIAKVKALRPNMPIVLYTGFHAGTTELLLEQSGADAVLLKPISSTDLAECIRRITPVSGRPALSS